MEANSTAVAPKRKKRLKASKNIDTYFLQLWKNSIADLGDSTNTIHVYAKMAVKMTNAGYYFTPEDVKNKIETMIRKYRVLRAKMRVGRSPASWPLYSNLHRIIRKMRRNNITEILSESGDSAKPISSTSVPSPMPLPVSTLLSISVPSSSESSSPKPSLSTSLLVASPQPQNMKELLIETLENNSQNKENMQMAMESHEEIEREFLELAKKKNEELEALEKEKICGIASDCSEQ